MTRMLRLACAVTAAAALPVLGLPSAQASSADTLRIAGSDRYSTSAGVSQQISAVHQRAGVADPGLVVIASGADFPDGLSAGPAAAFGASRVLLVPPTGTLPSSVRNELNRIPARGAVIVGGTAAVSESMASQVRALGISTTRVAGANRYETAADVAAAAQSASTMVVASGANFPDALSGGAAAAKLRGPVVLTTPTSLPAPTAAAIRYSQATQFVVLGGTGAVSDGVLAQIKAIKPTATVTRAGGATRYATAAAASNIAFPSSRTVYLASGRTFPDALSAGPAAGAEAAPVLLTDKNCVPKATLAEIQRLGATSFRAVGGSGVLSANVINRVSCTY